MILMTNIDSKKGLVDRALGYIFNPYLFISLIGPSFLELNLQIIQHSCIHSKDANYINLITNPINQSFISYNIQLFVLFFSFIFIIADTIKKGNMLLSEYKGNDVYDSIRNSTKSKITIFFFIGIFFAFILVLLSGSLATEEIVRYYSKEFKICPLKFLGINLSIPPIQSHLTHWRLIFVVYSFWFIYWENNELGNLIDNIAKKSHVE